MRYCQPVGHEHLKKMLEEKDGVKLGQTVGRPVGDGVD